MTAYLGTELDLTSDLTDGSAAGDWRLPTKAEWEDTIARAVVLGWGCFSGGSCTNPSLTNTPDTGCYDAGPQPCIGVQSSFYWAAPSSSAIFAVDTEVMS